MEITIVRHGKIDSNREGYPFNSKMDEDLNAEGVSQAESLGRFLANKQIDAIFSSPMKRTKQTAEIIQKNLKKKPKILFDERLKELDFGIFDGKNLEYVKANYRKIYEARKENKFQYKIPRGESYKMVYNRILRFLIDVYDKNKNIIIVTHATTLKLFIYLLTDKKLEDVESIYFTNTVMFNFKVEKNGTYFKSKCLVFNSTSHMKI